MHNILSLVMCEGEGSRLKGYLPEGQIKVMADINGRPFIDIFLEHYRKLGLSIFDFMLVDGKNVTEVTNFIDDYQLEHRVKGEEEVDVNWTIESFRSGTLGAISFYHDLISGMDYSDLCEGERIYKPDKPFLVLNGDTVVYMPNLNSVFTALEATANHDVVSLADFNNDRDVGIYAVSHELLSKINNFLDTHGTPCNIGDVFNDADFDTHRIKVSYPYYDIGTPEGLDLFRRLNG